MSCDVGKVTERLENEQKVIHIEECTTTPVHEIDYRSTEMQCCQQVLTIFRQMSTQKPTKPGYRTPESRQIIVFNKIEL